MSKSAVADAFWAIGFAVGYVLRNPRLSIGWALLPVAWLLGRR